MMCWGTVGGGSLGILYCIKLSTFEVKRPLDVIAGSFSFRIMRDSYHVFDQT